MVRGIYLSRRNDTEVFELFENGQWCRRDSLEITDKQLDYLTGFFTQNKGEFESADFRWSTMTGSRNDPPRINGVFIFWPTGKPNVCINLGHGDCDLGTWFALKLNC